MLRSTVCTRLRTFWEEITAPTSLWHSALDGPIVECQQWAGALTALMFGQPGFFEPRVPHDWLSSNQSVSYYKTSALKSTLEWLIDFDPYEGDAIKRRCSQRPDWPLRLF